MNRKGGRASKKRCLRADSITSRTSFTPDVTADSVKNGRSSCVATMRASVVLPTPGGPQRMNDGTLPVSKNLRKTPFFPMRCSCPMYSSAVRGRRRSAKGMFGIAAACVKQDSKVSVLCENAKTVRHAGGIFSGGACGGCRGSARRAALRPPADFARGVSELYVFWLSLCGIRGGRGRAIPKNGVSWNGKRRTTTKNSCASH